MISRTVLVAAEAFPGGLQAARVAAALGRGLQAPGALSADLCPLQGTARTPGELLASVELDARMRAARAVVIGAAKLDESTLADSVAFEIATRARQGGVPAYAVAATNALEPFDARILDLQVVLQARDARALRRAGERLALLV